MPYCFLKEENFQIIVTGIGPGNIAILNSKLFLIS